MNQQPSSQKAVRLLEDLETSKRNVFTGLYLTLFSVIGGVALGLTADSLRSVIDEFQFPWTLTTPQLEAVSTSAATFFILGVILAGYVLTVLYYHWSTTSLDVVLALGLALSLCMAAAYVDRSATWIVWIALVGLFGGLSFWRTEYQLNNDEVPLLIALGQLPSSEDLDVESLVAKETTHLKRSKRISFVAAAAIALSTIWPGIDMWRTSTIAIVMASAAIIAIGCFLLGVQYRQRFQQRRRVFERWYNQLAAE